MTNRKEADSRTDTMRYVWISLAVLLLGMCAAGLWFEYDVDFEVDVYRYMLVVDGPGETGLYVGVSMKDTTLFGGVMGPCGSTLLNMWAAGSASSEDVFATMGDVDGCGTGMYLP